MHELKVIDIRTPGIALCILMSAAFFSAAAVAQDANDPMEVCYRMSEADQRHACFDREMQRRHATANAAASSAPRTAPAARDDTVGLSGKQLIIKRKEEGIESNAAKPISATISRLRPHPGHLYDFVLDNGQVWESTDSEADLLLDAHETVSIRPGTLGGFFLKTAEGRSIRVHRVH